MFSPRKEPFRFPLGRRGEIMAWNYLIKHGYKILEKNFRCPIGEIDVIAEKEKHLIFIEVKTRTDEDFGRPEESVHETKQKKIVKVASFYLKKTKKWDRSIRFEVLAVTLRQTGEPEIRLIENAFTLDDQAWQP